MSILFFLRDLTPNFSVCYSAPLSLVVVWICGQSLTDVLISKNTIGEFNYVSDGCLY